MFVEKEFNSQGSILRGRWYAASEASLSPCIVMCHGTSATISMCLADYATEFQNKGINVFVYDHACDCAHDRTSKNAWRVSLVTMPCVRIDDAHACAIHFPDTSIIDC